MKLIEKLAIERAAMCGDPPGCECRDCEVERSGFAAGFRAANAVHAERASTDEGAWGAYYRPGPSVFLGLNEEEA